MFVHTVNFFFFPYYTSIITLVPFFIVQKEKNIGIVFQMSITVCRFRNFPKEDTLSSELNFSFESAPPIVGQCYAYFCTNRANFGLNGQRMFQTLYLGANTISLVQFSMYNYSINILYFLQKNKYSSKDSKFSETSKYTNIEKSIFLRFLKIFLSPE